MSERRSKFPPKLGWRTYTDREMAETLQLFSKKNNHQRASEKTRGPSQHPESVSAFSTGSDLRKEPPQSVFRSPALEDGCFQSVRS